MKRRLLATLISSLVLGVGAVHAQDMNTEVENNDPHNAAYAKSINIASGTAVVDGQVNYVGDVDYFQFSAKKDDVVTIDIDGGITGDYATDVDTFLGLYQSVPGFPLVQVNTDALASPPDDGSVPNMFGMDADPYIGPVVIPADGTYVVGVGHGGYSATFSIGGDPVNGETSPYAATGPYKLIISGVSPATTASAATADTTATAADTGTSTTTATTDTGAVETITTSDPTLQYVNIDIKPGSKGMGVLNPKASGRFPVAITSTTTFDATSVDTTTLTFGATGTEAPLTQCTTRDVNRDGLLDLVCFADNRKSGFSDNSTSGAATGKTKSGKTIKGQGALKVIPQRGSKR